MPPTSLSQTTDIIDVYIDNRREPNVQWANLAFISHTKRAPLNQRVFKDYLIDAEPLVLN